MRSSGNERGAGVIALVSLTAFSLFTILFEPRGSRALDAVAPAFCVRLVSATPLLALLSLLGSPRIDLALTAVLLALLLAQRRWAAALALLAAEGLILAVECMLRFPSIDLLLHDPAILLARPLGAALVQGTYPSGHTARALLLSGVVAALLRARLRPLGALVALLLGVLVGIERIVLGLHSGSDVLGGLLLGGGLACWYCALLPWLASRRFQAAPPLHTVRPESRRWLG